MSFYEVAPFKMKNELLARELISSSIKRLYETKLFGSGWPHHLYKNSPNLKAEHDATLIYG